MDLESDSKFCTKIKQFLLVAYWKIVNYSDSPAAERDHRCCFVVSFWNILWKVGFWCKFSTFQAPLLCLNDLTLDQVQKNLREQLWNERLLELDGKHLGCPRNQEVWSKHWVRLAIDLVSRFLRPPWISVINYIILEQASIVGYFYACCQSHYLLLQNTLVEINFWKLLAVNISREKEKDCWAKVFTFQLQVVMCGISNWRIFCL